MKFKVGDRVIRTSHPHGDSGMRVGDIGIVTRVINASTIIIDNFDKYRFDPDYFEKVEDNDTINFLP